MCFHVGIGVLDRTDRCRQGIAVIAVIEGIQQFSVLGNKCSFRRRGAGVDAEIGFSGIGGQIGRPDLVAVLTLPECIVVFPG